jgi:peptidoglycan L-alanyl-D-glutamate endopeptidase CwlK
MATSTEKRSRFLGLFGQLLTFAAERGILMIVWTFERSPQEQNFLYQQGRTRPGKIVTNCDGYITKSEHQKWLAIDLAVVKDGEVEWADLPEYHDLGEFWESLGGAWGGAFIGSGSALNDIYHFQL